MKQSLKPAGSKPTVLEWIVVGVMALFAVLGVACISIAVPLVFNFIPWLLWNHAVAPTFHLSRVGFWPLFGIIWFVCFVRSRLFPSKKTKG